MSSLWVASLQAQQVNGVATKHTRSICKSSSSQSLGREALYVYHAQCTVIYTLPVVVSLLRSTADVRLVPSWSWDPLFIPFFRFLWFRDPRIMQRSLLRTTSFYFTWGKAGFPHLQDSKRTVITLQCLSHATTCSVTFHSFSFRIPGWEV